MKTTITNADHPLNGESVEVLKVWSDGTHVCKLLINRKQKKGFERDSILHLQASDFAKQKEPEPVPVPVEEAPA